MSVAGYGEFRPVEPNGPRGSEANRRVEIFLVAMPSDENDSTKASSPAETSTPAPAPADTVVPMDSPAPANETPDLFK